MRNEAWRGGAYRAVPGGALDGNGPFSMVVTKQK